MQNTRTDVLATQGTSALDKSPAMSLVGIDINALLNKAIDSKSAVEIIKELRGMALEDQQRAAKWQFDQALAAFQSECPIIKKEKLGAKQAYKYCPLDQMIPQVQPLLLRHQFSFTLSSVVEDGWVKAVLELKHAAGHAEKSEFKVPVDDRNPMMNSQQKYGGAMTFAKRYAFCNALGIMTGDEDLDGTTRPRPTSPSAAKAGGDQDEAKTLGKELWALLKPVVSKEKGWNPNNWDGHNAFLWREEILDAAANEAMPNIKPERIRKAIEAAKRKI